LKKLALLLALITAMAAFALGQAPTADVMGQHDLGSWGPAPIQGALTTCQYCHAVHSGLATVRPLWSQKLSTATYTLYTSGTLTNVTQQPPLGTASNLCLSCHDGTVAPGQNTPYGNIKMRGAMASNDLIAPSGSLQAVHPFNFKLPLQPADNVLASVITSGTTGATAVKMINGNVQCTSCHEPHVQGLDSASQAFLVMDNTDSALCLACHVSTPTQTGGMALKKKTTTTAKTASGNSTQAGYTPFSAWTTSAHAMSVSRVPKTVKLGKHGTVRKNACLSCHTPHNAPGGANLLTGPLQKVPNMDAVTQNCITCHNGGSNVSPVIPNIYSEFAKISHPLPVANNLHASNESAVLNNNRHSTCVDCHEPHASKPTGTFAATTIRPAQNGVSGISALDGTTVVNPAQNQYETCLRCHGASTGKQALTTFGYHPTRMVASGDALNLLPLFSASSQSSHPVMHDRSSGYSQPSLLKTLLNIDGHTQARVMTARILCTDCHNSDDNREFGGSGPTGPHGSQYAHILERRYEYSRVSLGTSAGTGPGSTIQNLLPMVTDPTANGPYSLCAKCHDLTNIMANASFSKHSLHLTAGFSCSVCHTAHGTGPVGATATGARLVSFDFGVVANNDQSKTPVAYNRATNTCTLKCHNYNHNADGSVTLSSGAQSSVVKKR